MSPTENEPAPYPEFDEAGERNPVRVPLTEVSEQWEVNTVQATKSMEPEVPWGLGKSVMAEEGE